MRSEQMAAKQTPRYDGRCSQLGADEVARRVAEGQEYVIRMRVPTDGDCVVNDRLRGDIRIPWAQVDMQVLMKADGLPTYHLANVVDDHLMAITHVIRGEEWIPSAPKHQLLYQYFGWEMPELCHLPLLRNPDQSKLSKRKNPTSILFYRDQGFLPEALLNYLGRMGWSMPDEREQFSLDEMVGEFDIDRVSLGGPIFDLEKLTWLNGQWLKNSLTDEEYQTRLMDWMCSDAFFESALPHLKSRIDVFSEASQWLSPLWVKEIPITQEALAGLGPDTDTLTSTLQYLVWRFENISSWTREALESEIRWVADSLQLKLRDVMPVVFMALSGTRQAISAFDLAVLLGPDRTLARLRSALETAGGLSKKGLKRLEKSYQQACQSIDTTRMRTNLACSRYGAIAQLGERYNGIVEVGGSIPPSSTNNSWNRLEFSGLLFFTGRMDFHLGNVWKKVKSYIFDSGSVMRDSRSRPPYFLFLIRFIKLTFLVDSLVPLRIDASFALL